MKENKKKDTKIVLKFLAFVFASGVIGYIVGRAMTRAEKNGLDFSAVIDSMEPAMVYIVPTVAILMNVIFCLLSVVRLAKVSKMLASTDAEDEELNDIENKLNLPNILSSVSMILNMLFFSAMIQLAEFGPMMKDSSKVYFIMNTVVFVASYIWEVLVQMKTVALVKKINPEKKGNVLDTKFIEDWEASCDEAQKMIIYKSAYSAYRVSATACLTLWVISLIGQLFFNTGVFPVICICTIWLTGTLAYMITAVKLEK